ncbi:MAG TPA: ATP-binding protein, partial [Nautiliaceae bacterium]|nr:ATP-binding protein [Nautiliaceae bacterium]
MITEKEKKEKDLVKNKIEVILNKAKELKETFGFYPSILIEGRAGIGKSQSVLRWAARNNFKVIDIRLINYDIGDLMLKVPDGDSLKNRYVSWLKKLENTKENVILLLDEIDKAEPTIQRLAYQLVLDREVEGLKLSDNVMIVAIQNQTEDGIFNDLRREKPLWDRFVFRVRVDLDLEEFLDYAYSNFKTPELIVFLEKNRDLIYVDKEEELVVTPRRWEFLDKVLQTCDPDDL